LGEEIGWRGFLVPQLSKIMGFAGTALISRIIWAAWHFPLFDFSNLGSWVTWYELGCFTLMVLGLGFIYTWFRLKTGSIWTAMLLHGSHNLFLQSIFEPLTAGNELTPYFSDETGIVLAILSLLIGLFFWKRRNEIEHNSA
jgi:membrane protease YdiL (CAAX protease family)